jgi:hypothetical protein
MRHALTLLLLLLSLLPAAPAYPAAPALRVSAEPGGLRLSWQAPAGLAAAQLAGSTWASLDRGGLRLPVAMLALELPADANMAPQISALALGRAAAMLSSSPADLSGPAEPLPSAPLLVLRDAMLRGQRQLTLAFSPLLAEGGGLRQLTRFEAFLPGARLAGPPQPLSDQPFLADAAPPDPRAAQAPIALYVKAAGIQTVSAADLAAAGLDIASLDPSRLQLYRGAAPVQIAIDATGGFGGFKFYAPAAGDRWSATSTYWLTLEDGPNARMASRAVGASCAAPSAQAWQVGSWRAPTLYESRLAGPSGDYWYSRALQAVIPEPDLPAQPVSLTLTFTPSLPLAAGPSALLLRGAALYATLHRLEARAAGATIGLSWTARGNFAHALSFPSGLSALQLDLLPNPDLDRVFFDTLTYTMPALLDFGGQGATFTALADSACYSLASVAPSAELFDITNPSAPTLLAGWGAVLADDGPGRSYLLSGPGTLHRPQLSARSPIDLAAPRGADALYIAPAAFLTALEPLLAQRRAGGYAVQAIAVEAIYDGWGGGQRSPEAIREFLRYAAASWSPTPQALTLVGDGTSDPRNYFGYGTATHIPPYLAEVDPLLGQVACDACYAQLDGDSPLDDLLPDLLIGRLPVKSAAELSALVAKIIGYETSDDRRAWRAKIVYVADNTDGGGNFAAAADESAASLPAGLSVGRVYYDPAPESVEQPWRTRDPVLARERTAAAIADGAAIVNYLGHGLYYQWAVTGPPLDPQQPADRQNLLSLYDPDTLANPARLPIVLSMTCLTGAFAQPNVSGTTIDERLLLAQGGAIAVWSSAGASVAPGQQALLRGFYGGLALAPPERGPLGELVMAGLLDLYRTSPCCEDMLRTFLLLGDPLTPARIVPGLHELSLPMMMR